MFWTIKVELERVEDLRIANQLRARKAERKKLE